MERVGVIGTGAVGSRMARRLMAGNVLAAVYDIDPAARQAMAESGAVVAECPADVASRSDIVITCVTNDEAVREALVGPRGMIEGARPGSIVIETTTSTPTMTRYVAEALAKRGIGVIDAPVSRGVPAAENGTLSIMVGGEEAVIRRCMPILRQLGTDIIHTGALGTGHIAKAMNMMVLGVNLLAAAETVALGRKAGLALGNLLSRINAGTAESFMTSNHFPKYVVSERFDSNFSLGLMLKDVRVATRIAHACKLPALFGTRVEEVYALAAAHGMEPGDNTRIVPYVGALMDHEAAPAAGTDGEAAGPDFAEDLITMLTATTLIGSLEASIIGSRAGLSADKLADVLNASSGRSHVTQHMFPRYFLPRRLETGISLSELHAACRTVSAFAHRAAVPLFVSGLTLDLLALAIGRESDGADSGVLLPVLERLLGQDMTVAS